MKVRDAHSLYAEILAELGPLGLLTVLGVVFVPLVAAIRARRSPFVAPALAGFVALAVHAGVDWDWEVPAVMIAGLTCAGCSCSPTTPGPGRWTVGTGARAVILSAIVALSVLSFVTLTANRYLGQASAALDRSDATLATRDARRAAAGRHGRRMRSSARRDAALLDGSFVGRAAALPPGDRQGRRRLGALARSRAREQGRRTKAALSIAPRRSIRSRARSSSSEGNAV